MQVIRKNIYTIRIIIAIWLSAVLMAVPIMANASQPPKINASSAILTDAVTGQVLYSKAANVRRPMASTTKIMTAIIVLENCDLDEIVTASQNACKTPYTSLHLQPGEQIKVRDMMNALLIRSANDAAVALAEHVGGSVPGFAKMMNDKAKELGAKDTHFVNPNGLYAKNHYSTAHDLALITRYALTLPVFNEIVVKQSAWIERSMNKQDVFITTRSKFLKDYYGADGVKSGYIKQAGYCFVGSATRGGWRLVSAVLNSNDSQADTITLMNYGFGNFRRLILAVQEQPVESVDVPGGVEKLQIVPSERLHVSVKAGHQDSARAEIELADLRAPIRKGDKVGTMTAYVGKQRIASVDLQAGNDVGESLISVLCPWFKGIGLLVVLSAGVACGRATAKSNGRCRSRFS